MRNDQAVIRRNRSCVLGSYRTGDEASEYDGEDGCVYEEFHKLVTSGGKYSYSMWKIDDIPSIVRRPLQLHVFSDIRGYLLSALPEYPLITRLE